MNKILILLITTPLIYLLIALVLVLIPVQRNASEKSLDFEVLNYAGAAELGPMATYFTARDGNQIYYRYIQGDSEFVVVLLHGSGAEGRYLIPLAAQLNAALGVTVVIPDLRGHGESALAAMGDVNYLGQLEHDLDDLNRTLRSQQPNSTIILGGHSSGGGLVVKYGGNELTAFDGYILLAPYLGYKAPTVRPNSGGWVQVVQLRYAGLAMLNNVGITGLNGFPVLYFNRPSTMSDPLQADSYSYRLNESFSPQSYKDNLQANNKPILALVGKQDEAFYADKFEAVFRENAPHTELHIIAATKHLDLPNSQASADFIIEWLEKSFN